MADTLKLMAVLAHPDDESLGSGGILAKYATEGIETSLVTATRGERGWFGDEREYPGLEGLGQRREAELRAAAEALGAREVRADDLLQQCRPAGPRARAADRPVCPAALAALRQRLQHRGCAPRDRHCRPHRHRDAPRPGGRAGWCHRATPPLVVTA